MSMEGAGNSARARLEAGAEGGSASAGGLESLGYGALVFLASAGALVLEIVAGRLLAPYVGMSLYSWTAIIAVVLAGLSLGHWIGGHLARGGGETCRRRAALALVLASLATLLSLALLRLLSGPILAAGLGPIATILALTAVLFLLPNLALGLLSPLLTYLALRASSEGTGRVLGRMFAAGALGSIAGTLAAGFLFISWIGSAGTLISAAAVFLIMAVAVAPKSGLRLLPGGRAAGLGACLAVAGLLAAGFASRAFESPCDVESDYYCIRVVDFSPESERPSALMVLDHLGHGMNDRDDPQRFYSSYVELTDLLVESHLQGRRDFTAYFIGGGAFTLPRAWAARYPAARLTVSEIDPAVTSVAEDRLWFEPGTKVRLIHEDARQGLRRLDEAERFDVIVGDAFRDISIPAHLVTREFAGEVRARLRPGGVYVLTAIDRIVAPRFLFAVLRGLREVFPVTEVWADAEQLAVGGRATFLVLAGDRPTPTKRLHSPTFAGRLWARWPESDLARRIEESSAPALTDNFAPIDRLLYPVMAGS